MKNIRSAQYGEAGDRNQHDCGNADDGVLAFGAVVFEVISLDELSKECN